MSSLFWGMCVRPFIGQSVAGDAVVVRPAGDEYLFAVIDGLGHGPAAHEAAVRASRLLLDDSQPADISGLLGRLHRALKFTRGAAAGICSVAQRTGAMAYVGVGNTVCRKIGADDRRLVSKDGTLGQLMPAPLVQTLVLVPGDALVMHTDGVRSSVDAKEYKKILCADPFTAARRVVDTFGKTADDAGCLVIKYIG